MTPNTLRRAGQGRRDAYLAQVAVSEGSGGRPSSSLRSGPSAPQSARPRQAVRARGRGRDRRGGTGHLHAGWGVGAARGPSPLTGAAAEGPRPRPACGERGEGACPARGLDLGEHSDFLLYRGVWGAGNAPVAQGRVVGHPPFWGHETSSRRRPLSRGGGLQPKGGAGGLGVHPASPCPGQAARGSAGRDLEGTCPPDPHPSS